MRGRVAGFVMGAMVISLLGLIILAPFRAMAWAGPLVRVGGEVTAPATYSVSQLAALPSVTSTAHRPGGGTVAVQGVSLETLVDLSSPVLPSAKNALLRVIVTVQGADGRRVTFALGELDASFGDHPAVVALAEGDRHLWAPALVVPGDSTSLRWIDQVSGITVGVVNPTPTTPPSGAIDVLSGNRQVQLTSQDLSRLPEETLTVTFLAGTSSVTDTEEGPPLTGALAAARLPIGLTTWVAAVGSDGYVAVVTPAEAFVGGRPLLLSLVENGAALAQPRLVADGDVKGGRYVSMVVDLVVGEGGD